MLHDKTKVSGHLIIEVHGSDGVLKQREEVDNLVVTVGLGYMASRMKDAAVAVMSHMAMGSGALAAAAGNTALGAELGRAALTSTTVAGNQITYVASFNPGVATGAATEVGIFNDPVAGIMLNRAVFPVVNKQAGDTTTVTWVVTVNAAA